MARPAKQQRWLVRTDHEITRDLAFNECDLRARCAYVDSLFYLATAQGPNGIYPHGELAAEFGQDAGQVATELLSLGAWLDCGLGYQVLPYCGWRVIPEQRLPIPDAVRQAVYARDGFMCRQCGRNDDLTIDHIHPWSLGGSDNEGNLQTLCRSCNCRKGARC